ncbi:uncharacterized protein LOC111594270 [Drosophila hydei]|uniref:Uncharacterized protein LOC111594270 n=1 Tax=Drosophila hydei TaxID=7224 RepID=A0A6J1LD74_DROHY|nr:uncharacterized protein LOC111594270 [Drosophila hydei]
MWKWLIFVNFLFILHQSWAQRAVTCGKPVYMDCIDYCNKNCIEDVIQCRYNCEHGCGCTMGYVVRNNGACVKLSECEFEDITSEELTTPTPCTNTANEVTEANGEYILNLIEFETLNPYY